MSERRIPPIAGGSESVRERIERLVREGKLPREAVDRAEALWREQLQMGVSLPNHEAVMVALDDVFHVIVDARIWRKPERIISAIQGVFEIRSAQGGRRQAFSRWQEPDGERLASIIIEAGSRLWSLHLIDERRMRRYTRQGSAVLWKL